MIRHGFVRLVRGRKLPGKVGRLKPSLVSANVESDAST